jgi:hypothetical protein
MKNRLNNHNYIAELAARQSMYKATFNRIADKLNTGSCLCENEKISNHVQLLNLTQAIFRIEKTLTDWANSHNLLRLGLNLNQFNIATL